MENTYKKLGALVRERRREKDVSPERLSVELKVSYGTIMNYEYGKTRIPLHHLLKIVSILNLDFAEIAACQD